MSARIVQPAPPGWSFWFLWMLGTVVGATAGLLLSLPLNSLLVAALGRSGTGPWTATETALILAFKGAEGGVLGVGIGLGQWLVFREYLKKTGGWILATALAFVIRSLLTSNQPSTTLALQFGASTLLGLAFILGIFQWFVLRARVTRAGWWIALSLAGWGLALALIVATAFAQLPTESNLGIGFLAVSLLVPFAVAGGGMVWLLRQTAPTRQANAV